MTKNLKEISVSPYKTNIKESLSTYGDHYVQLKYIDNNIIYGDYIDSTATNTTLGTIGLWNYDTISEKFNFIKYEDNKRIWNYIIKDDELYYIEIAENENSTFTWHLKVANLDFSNSEILDKGNLYSALEAPKFIKDEITNKIYLISIYDTLKISNNQLIKYQSEYKFSSVNNKKIKTIFNGFGDHINKTGKFLRNPQYTIDIKNNQIIYTEVSYYDKEITYMLDLESSKQKEIYVNDDLDNWGLSEAFLNEKGYLLNYKGLGSEGKSVIIDYNLKEINIININGYKISRHIYDNNYIIYSLNTYTIFSPSQNEYIGKLNFGDDLKFKPYYLTDNSNKLILLSYEDDIYIVEL